MLFLHLPHFDFQFSAPVPSGEKQLQKNHVIKALWRWGFNKWKKAKYVLLLGLCVCLAAYTHRWCMAVTDRLACRMKKLAERQSTEGIDFQPAEKMGRRRRKVKHTKRIASRWNLVKWGKRFSPQEQEIYRFLSSKAGLREGQTRGDEEGWNYGGTERNNRWRRLSAVSCISISSFLIKHDPSQLHLQGKS